MSPTLTSVSAALALFLSIVSGWLNTATDELPIVIFGTGILAALQGAAFPRGAWLAGALIGAGVPVSELLGVRFHWHRAWPYSLNGAAASCIVIIVAIIAALIAAAVRSAVFPGPRPGPAP